MEGDTLAYTEDTDAVAAHIRGDSLDAGTHTRATNAERDRKRQEETKRDNRVLRGGKSRGWRVTLSMTDVLHLTALSGGASDARTLRMDTAISCTRIALARNAILYTYSRHGVERGGSHARGSAEGK